MWVKNVYVCKGKQEARLKRRAFSADRQPAPFEFDHFESEASESMDRGAFDHSSVFSSTFERQNYNVRFCHIVKGIM